MMKEENFDLFGYDNVTLEDIDNITPDDNEGNRWPEMMYAIFESLRFECKKLNIDERMAMIMLARLCKDVGGVQFYFPKGEVLEHQLKSMNIWRDFDGNNIFELAKKYDTSTQNIYAAIRKMRALECRKRQKQLF